MIKKALLATKEKTYDNVLSKLKKGDIFEYPTTRDKLIENLESGDLIYIRIQGTADITHIGRLIEKTGDVGNRVLHLEIIKIYKNPISAKKFYSQNEIKAGAEYGWIKKGTKND